MQDQIMQGKIVIVTGATSGIGHAIAAGLAAKGAETIIISRNAEKCAATVAAIQASTGNQNVRYYAADLSAQADVRALLETLNAELSRLDVLVNNAGAWFTKRHLSKDGIEMTWALDHLNYFLMAQGLEDLLKRTAATHGAARIINQASLAHHDGEMHWDDLEFEHTWDSKGRARYGAMVYSGWGVYCQAKLANVLHAFALARRLEGTGVVVNAVHPGVVVTGLSQNNGVIFKMGAFFRRFWNRTSASDGAAPAIYLASAPEAATITGAYYGPPHSPEKAKAIAYDVDTQERLWQISRDYVGQGERATAPHG